MLIVVHTVRTRDGHFAKTACKCEHLKHSAQCFSFFIFKENKEIQFSAVQCLLKLIEHSLEIDSALGKHFAQSVCVHHIYVLLCK